MLCLFGPEAFAKETARVLPATIFRARIVGVTVPEVRDTFNEEGRVQGLSHTLNRTVTMGDIINGADADTRDKLQTLSFALNSLQPGLGNDLAAANLYSDLRVEQRVVLGALEYGVTNKFSLGIRAPVITRRVKNNLRVEAVNNAAAIGRSLGNGLSPSLTDGLDAFSQKQFDTAFFRESLFAAKGYQAPADFERTELGDVEFGGKYNFFQGDGVYSTVLVGASVPTGAAADLRNPFDKGNSKETFCMAVQLFQEAEVVRSLTVGAAAKLGYSLRDTRARAVPKDADDSLPSLLAQDGQVQDVSRQRGMQLETELSAAFRFPGDAFGLWSAYQYSSKDRDSFRGPGNLYYEGLAKDSDWRLHAAEVGAEYSTINAFRKGKFPVPMEISLLYNRPLRGTNTALASYARMDLMVYF